jgi:hypothetical protein
MNILPKDELDRLIKANQAPCVSLYLPTHKSGPESEQDTIRFRNMIREAEQRLIDIGTNSTKAKELLAPVQKLLNDSFFWRHQNDGLAVFVSPELFRYFRLPLTFGQNVFVAPYFNITPLLPLFIADGRFYILSISKKNIRLYHCTRLSIREVELVKVPKSIDELLRYQTADQNLTCHSAGGRNRGSNTTIYHSHGTGTDDAIRKKDVLDFFYQVDRYLHKFLDGERAPMVLAGVEYEQSIYREASSYSNLLREGILGNTDTMNSEELHKKGWEIVEPHFKKSLDTAIEHFKQAIGTPRASSKLEEIVTAANEGRVELLFVTIGLQKWGQYNKDTQAFEVHETRQPGDFSLQNYATIQTLSKGGTVYVIEPRDAPVHAPLAAIYRY